MTFIKCAMSRLGLVFWKIINHQFWCGPQMITFSRSGPLLPALGTKDCTCDRHGRLNVLIRHFFGKPFPAGEASRTTRYTSSSYCWYAKNVFSWFLRVHVRIEKNMSRCPTCSCTVATCKYWFAGETHSEVIGQAMVVKLGEKSELCR